MKSLDVNRYALCISAAIAMLTGCGIAVADRRAGHDDAESISRPVSSFK